MKFKLPKIPSEGYLGAAMALTVIAAIIATATTAIWAVDWVVKAILN